MAPLRPWHPHLWVAQGGPGERRPAGQRGSGAGWHPPPNAQLHIHTHTCMHNCTHACTHMCMQTARGHMHAHVHKHPCTHACARTHRDTRICAYPRTHTHAATQTQPCTFMRAHAHICACSRIHMHAWTHTRIYTHECPPPRGHRHTHACTHKHLCTLTHTQGHGHIDIHTPTHPHACPRMHGDIDIHVYLCMLTHARTRTLMHAYTDAAAGSPIPVPSPAVPPPAAPAQPHAAAATCRRPETWGALAAPAHQQPHCSRAVLCGRTRGRATRDRGTRCRRGCQQSPAAENTSLSWRAKPQNPPSLAPPFKQPQEQCHLPKLPLALAAPALLWHPSVKAGRAPGCRLNNTPYK